MRSGRHRVIWLAAVFLALAVGVVLGSLTLSGPLVSGLRGDKGSLQGQIAALDGENRVLNEKLSAADQFDAQMSGRIVRDALAGKSVVLIRTPDAEDDDVDAVSRLVGQAGGVLTGSVGLTTEFVEANSAEKLQSVVNSPIVPAGARLNTGLADPSAQAGDLLGIALLINRDPKIAPVDDAARDTVLAALRDTGFLTYDEPAGGGQHRRRRHRRPFARRRRQPGRQRGAVRRGSRPARIGRCAGRPGRNGERGLGGGGRPFRRRHGRCGDHRR